MGSWVGTPAEDSRSRMNVDFSSNFGDLRLFSNPGRLPVAATGVPRVAAQKINRTEGAFKRLLRQGIKAPTRIKGLPHPGTV